MASSLGLVEIGLVASNMTLINIYNLVIDVHFCCVTIMKLSIMCIITYVHCQHITLLYLFLVRTLAEIIGLL